MSAAASPQPSDLGRGRGDDGSGQVPVRGQAELLEEEGVTPAALVQLLGPRPAHDGDRITARVRATEHHSGGTWDIRPRLEVEACPYHRQLGHAPKANEQEVPPFRGRRRAGRRRRAQVSGLQRHDGAPRRERRTAPSGPPRRRRRWSARGDPAHRAPPSPTVRGGVAPPQRRLRSRRRARDLPGGRPVRRRWAGGEARGPARRSAPTRPGPEDRLGQSQAASRALLPIPAAASTAATPIRRHWRVRSASSSPISTSRPTSGTPSARGELRTGTSPRSTAVWSSSVSGAGSTPRSSPRRWRRAA